MSDLVTFSPVQLRPDASRTVVRPFSPGDPPGFADPDMPRRHRIVRRVLSLEPQELRAELETVALSLDERHPGAEQMLRRRYDELEDVGADRATVSDEQALLIGAYFSEEFAFEAAALFNPSVVHHPDQSDAPEGGTRLVLSLRGIGEGHVSSLTFRTGTWLADGTVEIDDPGRHAMGPKVEMTDDGHGGQVGRLTCDGAKSISETVIFPFLPSQGRGVEDVRLVEFTEDDGTVDYRGTFTGFDGAEVRQALLRTSDFHSFEFRGIVGPLSSSKGLALFPRRVGGRHLALGRQDNENVWLAASDDLHEWEPATKILEPKFAWEFVQLGNCGSPIELDEGWLVLTHGVGVVRNYCIGACLLDKDDPSKVLARTAKPLLEPSDKARDGYVPNVVYSCGALVRGRQLLLPHGVADEFTAFATVDLDGLLRCMA